MIIRCDDDHGNFFDGGDVHPFVRGPSLHPSFTNRRQTNKIAFAFHSLGQQLPHDDWNHRPEMTDHGQLPRFRAASVNISVPATHRTSARPEIGSSHIEQRLAKSSPAGLITNQWCKDIPFLKEKPAGDTDRFLAFTEINASGN